MKDSTSTIPAFPIKELKGFAFKGLTKREVYALYAMNSVLTATASADKVLTKKVADVIADEAYIMADAMIERGQK